MHEHDRLINLLSTHWQTHQPTLVRQFQQENRLREELQKAAEPFAEMLYDLVVIQKIPYPSAWEMTVDALLSGAPEAAEHLTAI